MKRNSGIRSAWRKFSLLQFSRPGGPSRALATLRNCSRLWRPAVQRDSSTPCFAPRHYVLLRHGVGRDQRAALKIRVAKIWAGLESDFDCQRVELWKRSRKQRWITIVSRDPRPHWRDSVLHRAFCCRALVPNVVGFLHRPAPLQRCYRFNPGGGHELPDTASDRTGKALARQYAVVRCDLP